MEQKRVMGKQIFKKKRGGGGKLDQGMGALKKGAWTSLWSIVRFTRKYLLRNLFGNDYWILVCTSSSLSSYHMPTLKALRWNCCSVIYWKHTNGLWYQGYHRNSIWNFQRLIKTELEFLGVTKKKSCGISRDLGFWAWNF